MIDDKTLQELNAQVNEYAVKKLNQPKVVAVTDPQLISELINA